jgi:hypothetical protein
MSLVDFWLALGVGARVGTLVAVLWDGHDRK